jgi:hypothetical protein
MLSVVKLSVIRLNDNYNPFVLSAVMLNVAVKQRLAMEKHSSLLGVLISYKENEVL